MQTVYVGLSGGVDSSVTAALLKQQGYRVVGAYMQNWTRVVAGVDCPWERDLADAKAVAAALQIPFQVFDFETQYKRKVVDYMVAEYQAGYTPNPDVMCNQEIKFKLFLDAAKAAGADLIATGHYARAEKGKLYTAWDENKDQTYFLYRVTSQALGRSLMPLGELTKAAVRQLARELRLPTADKPDSQGICFIGEVGIKDFLKAYVEAEPGPVVDKSGKSLGEHEGAIFYTIGQRKGLNIGGGQPLYVTDKDVVSNTVTVTDNPQDLDLYTDRFRLRSPHWIDGEPDLDGAYQIRCRYRGPATAARLRREGENYLVELEHEERAVTPGQSAVVYSGDPSTGSGQVEVLGGGIIASA